MYTKEMDKLKRLCICAESFFFASMLTFYYNTITQLLFTQLHQLVSRLTS